MRLDSLFGHAPRVRRASMTEFACVRTLYVQCTYTVRRTVYSVRRTRKLCHRCNSEILYLYTMIRTHMYILMLDIPIGIGRYRSHIKRKTQ